MNTYYQVTAINKESSEVEIMFGSFEKRDCISEIDFEKHNWKNDGYKSFKVVSIEVEDTPDPEVYDLISGDDLFATQAPCFNFELDKEELISKGLEVGFITQPDPAKDLFIINTEY